MGRNSKRPFVTFGLAARAGYVHLPKVFGTPRIEDAPIELSGLDFETLPYAYDFDLFADFRISNLTYFQLGASLSKRHLRYVPKSTPKIENTSTIDLTYLRVNPAIKIGKLVLGGYYSLNVNAAKFQFQGISTNLANLYEEALKNDYGVTFGFESRQRRKKANPTTDSYFVKNFLIGIGYELSLGGVFNKDNNNIGNVDPELANEDNTLTPGYLYLKIGVRL